MNAMISAARLRPILVCASATILCLTVGTACARRADAPPSAEPSARSEAPGTAAPAASAAPGAGALTSPDPSLPSGRMVISEVTLSLRAEAPARAADRASSAAARAGGYVLSRDATSSEDQVVRVGMVLRVPSEKLEPMMEELRREGSVLDEARTGRDVTEEFSDTKAELVEKRKLEERFVGILAAAKSVKEMLEVEGELARVRGEADKLEGRTRLLENRAAFATITLSIVSPAQPAVPEAESMGSRLRNAFVESCSLGFQVTTSIIVALGALSPLIVPAGVVFWFVRRRRALRKALLSA